MLRIIDTRWMAHLQEMDYLKAGIGLRAFGQRDPLVEYKNEAYNAFQNLTAVHVRGLPAHAFAPAGGAMQTAGARGREEPARRQGELLVARSRRSSTTGRRRCALSAPSAAGARAQGMPAAPPKPAPAQGRQTYVKDKDDPFANVGRNDPCPCGSGLKYKKCHGRDAVGRWPMTDARRT